MIGNYQNRVHHSYNGFLLAAPGCQTSILSGKVGILGMRRTMSCLIQCRPQGFVSWSRPARASLSRRFVVPGSHTGPSRQVVSSWKTTHVYSNFRHDDFGGLTGNTWDRVQLG